MKVSPKQAMWEELSESYGLEYLQANSPSSYGNNSEMQSCLLEPQPFLHSLRSLRQTPHPQKGGEKTSPKQLQIQAYKMTIKSTEKLIGWGY